MTWVDPRLEELRALGAQIAPDVYLGAEVYIERDFAPLLTIESGVVVSKGVTILLHDSALNNVVGEPIKFGAVALRRNAYLGANVTVLCGVEIGEGAVVGACALVTSDVPAGSVARGQPAKVTGLVSETVERQRAREQTDERVFFVDALPWRERSDADYAELNRAIADRIELAVSNGVHADRDGSRLNGQAGSN